MHCGDCKHYEPARNPETNRPLPSQPGECTYPVEWPKLPKAFLPDPWTYYGTRPRILFPQRRAVRKDNKESCEMFAAKAEKPKAADQMMMPNDRVEGRDAALSRRVPSRDGLEGAATARKP